MRIVVFSERLRRPYDEGFKNVAVNLIRAVSHENEVLALTSDGEENSQVGIHDIRGNRLLLSWSLGRAVRDFRPEAIVYVPTASSTIFGLARARVLRFYGRGIPTALVALQPRSHSAAGGRLVRLLAPDWVLTQSSATRDALRSLGCRSALLPPAVDSSRFRPATGHEKADLRRHYGLPLDEQVVAHIGPLRNARNLTFFQTLSSLGGYHGVVVASTSTPQDAALKSTLLGAGATVVDTFVPTVEDIYRMSDVYLFLTEHKGAAIEMPLSVLEAMACNLAVISTPFGGLPDHFPSGRGLFYYDGETSLGDLLREASAAERATRDLVTPYTWENAATVLVNLLAGRGEDPAGFTVGRGPAVEMTSVVHPALAAESKTPEEICAAYLADPRRDTPDLPWSECDVPRLLQVLHENKVPLLALPGPSSDGPSLWSKGSEAFFADERFREARRKETELWASQRREYLTVHEAQRRAGVPAVFIKPSGIAPSFPFKSDNLDILYREADIEEVRTLLIGIGYVELKNVEEPHKYLFRRFRAAQSVSAIHAHAHVGWMVSFLNEEKLLSRYRPARDDDLVSVSAPTDALLTNLAHWFYEDKRLTLQDLAKCTDCIRHGVNWDEVFDIAASRGWSDGLGVSLLLCAYQEYALYGHSVIPADILLRAKNQVPAWAAWYLSRHLGMAVLSNLRHGEWHAVQARVRSVPLRVPFLFSKVFFVAKLLRDPSRSPARKLKDLALHLGYGVRLRLHIRTQPSMLIALSGTDGSGKTTQARALLAAFRVCDVRTDYVWHRGGSAGWISIVTHWLGRRPAREPSVRTATKVADRKRRFRSPWTRTAWSWLTTAELLLRYTARVTWPLLLGHVVICDRYVPDALADWAAYFDEIAIEKRLAAKALRLLCPCPQVAYWLDVPAQEAQSRSTDDLPTDILVAQRDVYRGLSAKLGLRRIDGHQEWEAISDTIVYDVLTKYFTGYHAWLSGLFGKNPGQWR